MAKTTLTHKLRNPKDYNSWMDIWVATVNDDNDYVITPSNRWQFSVKNFTDLYIPSYELKSDFEENTTTNDFKSITIKLQKDKENTQSNEGIKISAGNNVTLTGSSNSYSINSTWQQNSSSKDGYIPAPINTVPSKEDPSPSEDGSSPKKIYPKVVWGWPGTGDPGWMPLSDLNENNEWQVSKESILYNEQILALPPTAVVGVRVAVNDDNQVTGVTTTVQNLEVIDGMLTLSVTGDIVTNISGLG